MACNMHLRKASLAIYFCRFVAITLILHFAETTDESIVSTSGFDSPLANSSVKPLHINAMSFNAKL